jgi:spore germination protein (amino acid permease)
MGTIREGHIGYREALALLAIALSSKVFLTCPRNLAELGLTAGWLVSLVQLLVALIAVLPMLALLKAYPEHTLIEISEAIAGPVAGILVSMVQFLFFMGTAIIVMRQFTETIIVALLPTTPISIITIFLLLGIIYPCYLGIEALSRGAWLLMPFLLFGLIGVLLLILPRTHLDYLFPLWGPGLTQIIKAGAIKSSMTGEILLVSIFNPYLRERKQIKTVVIGSLIIYGILFTLTMAIYEMVFPYPSAVTLLPYPLYMLARIIYYGRFLQRVESIFIFIWVFSLLVTISSLFYGATLSLARGLKLPVYQPLLFPLAILVYSVNFLIPNFPAGAWLDSHVLHNYSFIVAFGLPALVWLMVKIWNKRVVSRGLMPEKNI